MTTIESLEENFRFLTIEATNLVEATLSFLDAPSRTLFERIISRDDYVDNLKNVIENTCFSKIHGGADISGRMVDTIRSVQIMCANLERIADFCVNITRQVEHFADPRFLHRYDYRAMFTIIRDGLARIAPTRRGADLTGALEICKAENQLDALYKEHFDRIMAELSRGGDPRDLITALFIFRYLERVGDSLLNIGEALIFSILGERIKIEQFEALRQTLDKGGFTGSVGDIDFKSIWGSRSGCRIGRVASRPPGAAGAAPASPEDVAAGSLYKEGNLKKIRREKDNIERWAKVFPGIGPRIFSFHEDADNDHGAMLVEFLPGCTLDEVILSPNQELATNALFVLTATLHEIWAQTLTPRPCPTRFMAQLEERLEAVRQVHPDFERPERSLGLARIAPTSELIARCKALEAELPAPASMLIHGDFNTNNVVYDHERQQVHFIDLYRSTEGDYVQDVAVFLVSNFRVPLKGRQERDRLNWVIAQFLEFAAAFAGEMGDTTFQARLALGLARSLYTSTRFELHPKFSKEMCLRAHFLMEKTLAHQDQPWEAFRLPEGVLYY
jgi:phosphate uptake regulator